MEKIRNFFRELAKIFKGLSDIVDYSETQKNTDKKIVELISTVNEINCRSKTTSEKVEQINQQMTKVEEDMEKLKSGLQKELYQSLSDLRNRCVNKHFSLPSEKDEAQMYYDEIHKLFEDGFSEQCYSAIMKLPNSKEEYLMSNLKTK